MEYIVTFLLISFSIFVVRMGWRAWRHPSSKLERQAMSMNWSRSRTKKMDGYRNTCVTRDGMEAMINFNPTNVHLIEPNNGKIFLDFIELENWISSSKNNDPEVVSGRCSNLALESFMKKISSWPKKQEAAAAFIVATIAEQGEGDIDSAFGELTVNQAEIVYDLIKEVFGE